MIGFDRSALAAIPTNQDGNQKVNRVVVRFMRRTSGASIKNSNQTSDLLAFRIKTKANHNKGLGSRASHVRQALACRSFGDKLKFVGHSGVAP